MDKYYKAVDFNNDHLLDILNSMPGGVFIYRADNEEILYLNSDIVTLFDCSSFEEFFEFTKGKFANIVHKDDMEMVYYEINNQLADNKDATDHLAYRIKTASGQVKMIEDYGRKIHLEGIGDVFVVFAVDNQSKNTEFSNDRLTGLEGKGQFIINVNHHLLMDTIEDHGQEDVLLYFNTPNFKLVNLKYGMQYGDDVLKSGAMILKDIFSKDHVARVQADQFAVFTARENIEEKVAAAYRRLQELHPEAKFDANVGAYIIQKGDTDAAIALDYAKLACDSSKQDPDVLLSYFDEDMRKNINTRYYVVNHIDEAIEKGYIKVFYQPVIRSITGSLCGFEALARWIDPVEGFMSPADFIPALEDAHLIHKLDIYIIREVCRRYRYNEDHNIPNVPVSFNLSRLDFLLSDIRKDIVDAATQYNVPHDMLNIEITESLFTDEAKMIKSELDFFHSVGFNVWMDDFGSGFSSLNTLKYYDFDELKIDMVFLSTFNERSKDILKSIVNMAKSISIQTLAEGVETKEHFEFLKEIGCEKIQGYYFGKPSPYDEAMDSIREKGIEVEERDQRSYFDDIGKVNTITDMPLALLEYDGLEHFKLFYMNQQYLDVLSHFGTSTKEKWIQEMNTPNAMLIRKFRAFAYRAIDSKQEETLVYSDRGRYAKLKMSLVAEHDNHATFRATLADISHSEDEQTTNHRDSVLRHMLGIYDGVFYVDLDEDSIELVETINSLDKQGKFYGVKEKLSSYATAYLQEQDYDAYMHFMDPATMNERILASGKDFLSYAFKTRVRGGEYKWCVHTVMRISKSNGRQFVGFYSEASVMNGSFDS